MYVHVCVYVNIIVIDIFIFIVFDAYMYVCVCAYVCVPVCDTVVLQMYVLACFATSLFFPPSMYFFFTGFLVIYF